MTVAGYVLCNSLCTRCIW